MFHKCIPWQRDIGSLAQLVLALLLRHFRMTAAVRYLLWFAAGFRLFSFGHCQITDPCPFWPGAPNDDKTCFKIFYNSLDFEKSQEFCEQQGQSGSLAETVTQEQWSLVNSLVPVSHPDIFWVGGYYISSKKSFLWMKSGKGLENNSSFWKKEASTQYPGGGHCVALIRGGLINTTCTNKSSGLICQRDVRPATNPCHFWDGALYVNKKCFKTFSLPSNWSQALDICRSQGPSGTLAVPQTKQEEDVIVSMLPTKDFLVWLGNTTSGVPQVSGASSSPSNSNSHKYCEAIMLVDITNGKPSGQLKDLSCAKEVNFTCQITVTNPCDKIMPDGAEYFEGRCYFYVANSLSWSDSQDQCRTLFASLAQPTTTDQQSFILDLSSRTTTEDVWLGASTDNGQLRWSLTGDLVQNFDTPSSPTCFLQVHGQSRTWHCGSHAEKHAYICERDHGNPCETIMIGGLYISGQCFKYVPGSLMWDDAQKYCQKSNSILAEPETQDLSDALNLYLKSLHVSAAWIGGQRIHTSSNFQWVTSKRVLTYTLLRDSTIDHGDRMFIQDASYWSLAENGKANPFICQASIVTPSHPNQWYLVTPFPKLQYVSDLEAFLQITYFVKSFSVLVEIYVYAHPNMLLQKTSVQLEPSESLNFNIDSRLLMALTGVYTGYVQVYSLSPVQVVMYVFSSSKKIDASTLLLPRSVINCESTVASYFLISSCIADYSVNSVTAMTTDGPSDITVLFHTSQELGFGGVMVSEVETAKATTHSKFGSVYLNLNTSFDGAYLFCPDNASVLIGGSQTNTDDQPGDIVIDQLLPVELIDSEYFTFPSRFSGVLEFVNIVAVKNNTKVTLFQISGNNRTVLLPNAGDVAQMMLPNERFLYLKGNQSFYAIKLTKAKTGSSACLTSLYSSNLWKRHYNFQMTPQLMNYNVNIAVIVDKTSSHSRMGISDMEPKCNDITGSTMAGCVYSITSNNSTYYNIYVGQEKLAAYLTAMSASSIICHAMGISNNPKATFVFDHDEFLNSLRKEPPCETSTTEEVFNTTIEPTTVTSKAITSVDFITTSTNKNTTSTAGCDFSGVTIPPTDFSDFMADLMNLFIDLKKTSAYKRTKISVPDARPSAARIGYLGISCLLIAFAAVALTDVLTFCQWIVDICKH